MIRYSPAVATDTPSSLASLKSRMVLPFGKVPTYPGCPRKEAVKQAFV